MDFLTKNDLEKLADKVAKWANQYGKDWSIFYNGKRMGYSFDLEKGYEKYIQDDVNPIDYCEYFPEHFIMGMSYDGAVYDAINWYEYDELEELLKEYGLYLEHLDNCHCHFYELNDDMEVQYTIYTKPKEYCLIRPDYCRERWTDKMVDYPKELDTIMELWKEYSSKGNHAGLCVIGEYVGFTYKGNNYRMSSQCVFQGEGHYHQCVEYIKPFLEKMGATDIYVNYGMLD